MAEPITIGTAVIAGLVAAYKAYTDYKAAVVKAEAEKAAAPAKSAEAAKGEQVAPVVKAAVQQHGTAKEQTTLELFEGDPDTYRTALEKVLADLATKNSAFAGQLQTVAQQADIQTGGVSGTVNVSGEGKVYGAAVGVNIGEIKGEYKFGAEDDEKKA
jgi:Na+-transporting methylmalonyl-CoA/oxaloacetate decarboxylase gamma subunit